LAPREVDDRQAQTFPFTPPFNMTNQPSLSLPLAQSSDGLPIGMMFTGRWADEATLYRLAGQLEQAKPWIQAQAAALELEQTVPLPGSADILSALPF